MSFYANTFIFDGVSCDHYGLELYNLDSASQSAGAVGGPVSISETRTASRCDGFYYGDITNEPLTFNLVFGIEEDWLSRFDIEIVAGWLIRRGPYRWLHVCQDDMVDVKYRCKITELTPVEAFGLPRAYNARVVCDCPYAYKIALPVIVESSGTATYQYHNGSNVDYPYYPLLTISVPEGTTDISIENDVFGKPFTLSGLSGSAQEITVDCKNLILTSSINEDLYPKCNLEFPAFYRGDNNLTISGACTITIPREWYVNVGF